MTRSIPNRILTTQEQRRRYEEYEFKTTLNPFRFDKASYNIGFIWNINKYFTLGGVFKPEFTAEIDFVEEAQRIYDVTITTISPPDVSQSTFTSSMGPTKEDQKLDMPASYGLGLACRSSDQFTMDLDVYRTDWQNFVLRKDSGDFSLITGQDISLSDTEPTHQVRMGAEYLFLLKDKYVVPVRAGVFYDPEPTDDEPDTFYGISLGGGIAIDSFVFDMAYQYRWGNGVRKIRLVTEETYQDVEQHTIYASVIYHF